jgi:VIT1/CCC1 family predicted Fe2+/Mn2+ transporter
VFLDKEIRRSNLFAATVSGITTFIAGSVPIVAFVGLPALFKTIAFPAVVAVVSGIFLVRYRSRKTRVHWKITLPETLATVAIATIASVLLGLL